MMGADGAGFTRLETGEGDARDPVFHPSGDRVVYAADGQSGYQIWSIHLSTGQREQLTTGAEARYPAFDPERKRYVHLEYGDPRAIVVRSADDNSVLRRIPSADAFGAPSWGADANELWTSARKGLNTTLEVVSIASGERHIVAGVRDVFPFRSESLSDGSVLFAAAGKLWRRSPEGASAVAVEFAAELVLPDRLVGPLVRAPANPDAPLRMVAPQLSPDGKQVAYAALGDIWTAPLGPREVGTAPPPIRISNGGLDSGDVDWSPDGKQLIYTASGEKGRELLVFDTQTQATRRLSIAGSAALPAWSPDGRRIAFVEQAPGGSLFSAGIGVLDLEAGEVTTVLAASPGPSRPAWSPDSARLALVVRDSPSALFREGRNRLVVIDLDRPNSPRHLDDPAWPALRRRDRNGPVWTDQGLFVSSIAGLLQIHTDHRAQDLGAWVTPVPGLIESLSASSSGAILMQNGDRLLLKRPGNRLTRDVTPVRRVQPRPSSARMTVRAPRVFDPEAGAYQYDVDVHVEGSQIADVVSAGSRPVTGLLVDLSDANVSVLPGLIEGHAHVDLASLLDGTWLNHGVTTVRDPGSDPAYAAASKQTLRAAKHAVPALVSAGPLLTGGRVSYGIAQPVTNSGALRQEIQRHADLGLDFIKSYVRADYRLQRVGIQAAHAAGLRATSHELYPAVVYGVDAVEHLLGTSRRGFSWKASAEMHAYGDVIAILGHSRVPITPTIAMYERFIPGSGTRLGAVVRRLVGSGAVVAAGTDAPFVPYGSGLIDELMLYHAAGLTTAETLRTAMTHGAELAGLSGITGRIAPGFRADLFVVEGDPLANFDDIRNVRWVLAAGRTHRIASPSQP